ncbi:glycoside hydrolase family 44 protein [uncultured Ruminococcus sp.]|uniref:glycoside hydrolase family 44 protein n=1 Tax=uncultured Ruminococcus sp. TaxID=165186 RepID=UPI0025E707ED|nr:glycoside hydrolase family 44 protein [uncultured Ruminococcus sp.]
MGKKHLISAMAAAAAAVCVCTASAYAADDNTVNITIDPAGEKKTISPYIYGVNEELMGGSVMPTAIRAGGNRSSAYNWETNASNAGSDRDHISDNYFQQTMSQELWDVPGAMSINLKRKCEEKNNAYAMTTLQLAGYVSADMDGTVTKEQKAPSDRWNKVELIKGSEFADTPDLTDGTVYMDEYVNYLINTLGTAKNGGIQGYSMDNEPSLWHMTHARMHPNQCTCEEIIDKNVTMAKAVKQLDPDAEVFGPALYGYSAFVNFSTAPDWNTIKSEHQDYRWFIDYYLDEMKKAEDENGVRLVDALDVHYYTEAKGECGERSCKHYSNEACVKARFDSVKSLWDETYKEDSWITDTGGTFLPLLPNLKQSIDQYYPGTKIAITEYDFGGSYDICGAIAEVEALGAFMQNDVYLATLFAMEADYQCAAIDLFTNYDGNGGHFGDTLLTSETDNFDRVTAYAATEGDDTDVLTLVVTNKAFKDKTTANITIKGGEYSYCHLYGLNSFAAQVFDMTDENPAVTVSGDTITLEMEPETVSLLVLAKDKSCIKTAAEDTNSAGDTSASENDNNDNGKKGGSGGAIAAGIAGAAACGAGIFAFMRKKKKT